MLFEDEPLPLLYTWLEDILERQRTTNTEILDGCMVAILAQALGMHFERYSTSELTYLHATVL